MKNIYFKIVNLENDSCGLVRASTQYVDFDDSYCNVDSASFLRKIRVDIMMDTMNEYDEYNENPICIGYIEGIYFDVAKALQDQEDILLLLDSVSSETFEIYEGFLSGVEEVDMYNVFSRAGLFYLTGLFLEAEYRNRGIGSYVVRNISKIIYYLTNLSVSAVLVYASPMVSDRNKLDNEIYMKKEQNHLRYLYEKHGFIRGFLKNFYYIVV